MCSTSVRAVSLGSYVIESVFSVEILEKVLSVWVIISIPIGGPGLILPIRWFLVPFACDDVVRHVGYEGTTPKSSEPFFRDL